MSTAKPSIELQRRSPPTARVLRVLEVLAAEPQTALSLTAIARKLGLSSATCLGILNELTFSGYLVREKSSRAFKLGPALLPLSQAASISKPELHQIQVLLQTLSAHFKCDTSASSVLHDQVVLLDVATHGDLYSSPMRIGMRFPFMAPVAPMHALWESNEKAMEWMNRSPIDLPQAKVERIWNLANECRKRGFLVRSLAEGGRPLTKVLSDATRRGRQDELVPLLLQAMSVLTEDDYLASEYENGNQISVSAITAPIFNAKAEPEFLINVFLNRYDVSTDTIESVSAHLMKACGEITLSLGGKDPAKFSAIRKARWSPPLGSGAAVAEDAD